MKTKLTVTTDLGTFTRTTDRTYTHLVVGHNVRHEVLEADRLAGIAYNAKMADRYAKGLDGSGRPMAQAYILDGSRDKWAAGYRQAAADLIAKGPITEDVPEVTVLGWSGRLGLAQNVANSRVAGRYRHVVIFDVVSGTKAGGR